MAEILLTLLFEVIIDSVVGLILSWVLTGFHVHVDWYYLAVAFWLVGLVIRMK